MSSKKAFLVFMILLTGFVTKASHIVGGEFELRYLGEFNFEVRLIQYFDEINGNPGAKDGSLVAFVFDKKNDQFIERIVLTLVLEEDVDYSVPECADDNLVTSRLTYLNTHYFDPELYNDPEGYYLVWERCCRNYVITNISSPETTGQTFYLEFPPVIKDGVEYINNTPQLFPPLSDYGCVNRFYYADFAGTDPDGDSLVYSLSVPLNSSEFVPVPTPTPAPHPEVVWAGGSNDSIQVPGNPYLTVSKEGLLTVTPSMEGLFVFAVKVEEFRNGNKIGEVRRDFQLFVIDCPDPGNSPVIAAKSPQDKDFVQNPGLVEIDYGEETCFEFIVTDQDTFQVIDLVARAVNFNGNVNELLTTRNGVLSGKGDTLTFKFCLPECPIIPGEPIAIDVFAKDRTCPQPLMDTLRLTIIHNPPPNEDPVFTSPSDPLNYQLVREGESFSVDIQAVDLDLDQLEVEIEGLGSNISTFGFNIVTLENEPGIVKLRLNWETGCEIYPFGLQNQFPVFFTVDDNTICPTDNKDTIAFLFEVELPENEPPIITINNNSGDRFVTLNVGDDLELDVFSNDSDKEDDLTLVARGVGFDIEQVGMQFNDTTGNLQVSSPFRWGQDCDTQLVFQKDTFEILFVSEDLDICQIPQPDTLKLTVLLKIPENKAPVITYDGYEVSDTISLIAGDLVELNIKASDPEGDTLKVFWENRDELASKQILFTDSMAMQNLSLPFSFQTQCTDLEAGYQQAVYQLSFVADDEGCYADGSDTTQFFVVVEDKPITAEFDLPNVFTPDNRDNKNDFFYIKPVPEENCESAFLAIEIYNRWGRRVYQSFDKEFKWDGGQHDKGLYYYVVKFTDRKEKGTITILR